MIRICKSLILLKFMCSDDYKENLENAWTLEPGEGMKRRRNGYRDDKTGQRTPNRSQLLDDQDILTLTRKEGRQHLTSVNQVGPLHVSCT